MATEKKEFKTEVQQLLNLVLAVAHLTVHEGTVGIVRPPVDEPAVSQGEVVALPAVLDHSGRHGVDGEREEQQDR